MNLFDSSFLCLDIGTAMVRGIAHCVRGARIVRSAIATAECGDAVAAAIMAVVDNLEGQLGVRFDSAYITGNFGDVVFGMSAPHTAWRGAHKITASDVRTLVAQISCPDGFHPMHIVPLRYDGAAIRNMKTPVAQTDTALMAVFASISYSGDYTSKIFAALRRAHIQIAGVFDSMFLMAAAMRPARQTVMFIDMGAAYTSGAIWTPRGPVAMTKIPRGQTEIINKIANAFDIHIDDAVRVRRAIPITATDMDRFTPADPMFGFSRADAADVVTPVIMDIINELRTQMAPALEKYKPAQIFLAGGGADIDGIDEMMTDIMNIPVKNIGPDAALRALSDMVWMMQAPRVRAYNARRDRITRLVQRIASPFRRRPHPARRTPRQIPIMPSTLAFNMQDENTYSLFRSAGISMIHVDIMDGFFVDRVAGGIDELKYIRAHTNAHLMVHLMTDSPAHWATDAANAGADTIIVSAPTAGVRDAIAEIHRHGRRAGIALGPDMSLNAIKSILRDIDDVLVMSVRPGAGGQEFMPGALRRIATLNATRKKYDLKFRITVDGGINADTAQQCWAAGADCLVAGTYLANATDFPLAVQRLMPRRGGI